MHIVLLKLTNDGHEASRGLSATAELLMTAPPRLSFDALVPLSVS